MDVISTFEFLNQREGGVVEVIYEGECPPEFKGTIKGFPQGFESADPLTLREAASSHAVLPRWVWFVALLVMLAGTIYDLPNINLGSTIVRLVIFSALGVIVLIGRRQVRSTIPLNV